MTYPPPDPRHPGYGDPYPHPAAPPPTRRRRRIITVLGIVLSVVMVGAIAGVFYVHTRLAEVERVAPEGLATDSGAHPGTTILLVGSDSREDLIPGQEHRFGGGDLVAGQRSDAIMLLRTQPGGRQASVLSIPRDLWVPIAGTGRSGRINSAYSGGPDRLVTTITDALGIPIDHYIEVNFDGFRAVVDAIGGLNMHFPAPARDILAELDIPAAGCVLLDGEQGLAYVRSRGYESLLDGQWVSDPTGDIGRMERQQDFMRRMIKKAISKGVRNPVTAHALLNSLVEEVTIDDQLSTFGLVRLGNVLRSVGGEGLETMTIPTVPARIGGASVLQMQQPEASQTVQRFLDPPAPADPGGLTPAEVAVRVLNGSGRAGEAGATSDQLSGLGFAAAGVGDANTTRRGTSLIRFPPGAEDKAALLQAFVGGGAERLEDPALPETEVVLVTGTSFTGVSVPQAPPEGDPGPPDPECPV